MQRRKSESTTSLVDCAELILPWLTPQELATVSLTSKPLSRVANSIAAVRRSDAARGTEAHPIPFVVSPRHHSHRYSFFLYTPSSVPSSLSPKRQPWPCVSAEFGNRASQRRVSVGLKIVWDSNKGWCLFARDFIPKNTFVCEYAGELLTTEEARRRQRKYDEMGKKGKFSTAMLIVREHLPSGKACLRLNIDATIVGNVGRFINHSCDGGNLSTELVRSSGSLLPSLCFFASKHINEHEELTFSYGGVGPRDEGSPCYCGTSACFGWLPSEQT